MKQQKKVLHIVGAMNRGGTETMLMNLYRNIDRDKIQFDFVSFSQAEAHYDEEIKLLGGKVIKISKSNSVKELIEVINDNGPYAVVHAHTLFNSGIAMLAAKKCGVKVRIVHAHTTKDDSSSLLRKIYIKSMRYLINNNSTNTLACSKEAGKYLFGDKEIKKNKHNYFPNLINYEDLLKEPKQEVEIFKEKQNLKDSIVIGHIGTFKESKNHKFLLEITKYMKEHNIDIKLLLVGDGGLRIELETLAKEYNIYGSVRFVGIREDINVMLHSMDVFVFPSIFEGLGLVLLEAQATGLPCIVSEAIQAEADLDLGLVNQLNLSDGVKKWSQEILKVKGIKERNINKIKKSFEEKEYSTDKCIYKLMKLYNIDDKEIYKVS
ncbi:glycosyltransferase family 1 protein [Terrisporobacter vanillatitrophus]|uniref:glycosyltransferase family 1 protein n=1 Tax=Terrisporobacter vanillatitrophus TaxID=3058402 RepID=UPI003369111E